LLPKDNDRSCVLRVRTGRHTLLLPGDVERAAESEIIERGGPGPIEVMLVPHHGSRSSSSADFVAATRPRWALVSAGHRNRWGFPAAQVVERWQAGGSTVLVVAATGAIEFEVHPNRPLEQPRQWRLLRRRAWLDP